MTSNGQVWCWGDNNLGEQNETLSTPSRKSPRQILGFSAATNPAQQIDAGKNFTCGVDNASKIMCWGTHNGATYKTDTVFSTNTTSLGTGDNHVCASHDNGTVSCWSDTTGGKATPPVLTTVQQLMLVLTGVVRYWQIILIPAGEARTIRKDTEPSTSTSPLLENS